MRFLALFLAALVPMCIVYEALALLVDPRGDFGTGVFPVVNVNARADKMRLFTSYSAKSHPEGLILGSSRAMKVRPKTLEALTGRRFFNFAVENARTEDYLAIYRWVRKQHGPMEVLLIGLDVEALHSDDRPDPDLLRNDGLMATLPPGTLHEPSMLSWFPGGRVLDTLENCKDTFRVEYVTDTLRAVNLRARPLSRPVPFMNFESDGYLTYPRWEAERATGSFRFDKDLGRCFEKYLKRFENMNGLSERRRGYLEQLVSEAHADGSRVLLWITSLHPLTVRYLDSHTGYENVLAATRDLEGQLADRFGVSTYDFSREESYQGDPFGWYDCAHVDETNSNRMLAALFPALT